MHQPFHPIRRESIHFNWFVSDKYRNSKGTLEKLANVKLKANNI